MRMVPAGTIQEYLDNAIKEWRLKLNDAKSRKDKDSLFPAMENSDELMAKCYVDAYQSARVSLLGSELPEDA